PSRTGPSDPEPPSPQDTRRSMRAATIAALATFLMTAPGMSQPPTAPEITLRLSSDRVLLGEPVWILLTARNPSRVALRWNPGDYCHMYDRVPVSAVVPGAAPGPRVPQPCQYGRPPGSCYIGTHTTVIAPGGSVTWRFLLEGAFHFVRPGTYEVRLTS